MGGGGGPRISNIAYFSYFYRRGEICGGLLLHKLVLGSERPRSQSPENGQANRQVRDCLKVLISEKF